MTDYGPRLGQMVCLSGEWLNVGELNEENSVMIRVGACKVVAARDFRELKELKTLNERCLNRERVGERYLLRWMPTRSLLLL